MVTTVDEMIAARALFDREVDRAVSLDLDLPEKLEIGVMLETPSLAWQVSAVCDHADFVSVGANDLMQFFFAADRDNARVSDRYDPLHPAALSVLKFVADRCEKNNTPVSVCGEIAARPLEAVTLAALGYRTLSMPVTRIGPVKAALLKLDTQDLAKVIAPHISVESRLSSLREIVVDYCTRNAIPV